MNKFEVSFRFGGKYEKKKNVTFKVEHNLPDNIPGMSIEEAFDNWSARNPTDNVQDFCDYVQSKDPGNIICRPIS